MLNCCFNISLDALPPAEDLKLWLFSTMRQILMIKF